MLDKCLTCELAECLLDTTGNCHIIAGELSRELSKPRAITVEDMARFMRSPHGAKARASVNQLAYRKRNPEHSTLMQRQNGKRDRIKTLIQRRHRYETDAGYRAAVNAYNRQWRAEHPEVVREMDKRRKTKPGVHEARCAYHRRWRAANPEKSREYHRRYKASELRYRQKPETKAKKLEYQRRWRAAKKTEGARA